MRRFSLFVTALALSFTACTAGARYKTDGEAAVHGAVKWENGPVVDFGAKVPSADVGIDAGIDPLPGVADLIHGSAPAAAPTVPPVTDAAVTATLATLAEKASAAEKRVADLEARANAPTATPEDKAARDSAAEALRLATAAKAAADEAGVKAREATDKANATPKASTLPPVEIPTDWSLAGIITAAIASAGGVAEWLRRKKAYKAAQEAAAAARAEAKRLADEAIARFDAAPDNVAFQPDGSTKPVA